MKIEKSQNVYCDYGCNQLAEYELDNGKMCCSDSHNKCPATRAKNGKLKLVDRECPFCQKEFKQINVRVFANHVRWCDKNPKHNQCCGEQFKQKLSNSLKKNNDNNLGEFKEFDVVCFNKKCQKHFSVIEREKKFPEKEHYFCCSSCAHSFVASNKSIESKQKTGQTLKNKKHIIKCVECGKPFEASVCVSKAKCLDCRNKHKRHSTCITHKDNDVSNTFIRYNHYAELEQFALLVENKDLSIKELAELRKKVYRIYRTMCSFTFSVKDFPNEFDIELLKSVGMYSAKNHGNNMDGVSRDHMYSCADGFKNNISPLIISHPANCQLITQRDNASKRHNSSITLDELMQRIVKWEQKYGKYEKKNVLTIPENLFNKIQNAKICHPMNYGGYKLIYDISTMKMKWWNVEDQQIPDGWSLEMPLELRIKHNTKVYNKSK